MKKIFAILIFILAGCGAPEKQAVKSPLKTGGGTAGVATQDTSTGQTGVIPWGAANQVLTCTGSAGEWVTPASGVTAVTASSPIVSSGGYTPNITLGTVPITDGGTSATTAAGARVALSAASSGANVDITSLTGLTTALPFSEGGTGKTTQAAALTALTGTQHSGYYARSDGTNTTLSAINAADVPLLNQSTTGNALTATTATSAINFSGSLVGDVTGTQGATAVGHVAGQTAANVAAGSVLANTATNLDTASTIVRRDGAGNFNAGTITAALNGNAQTASTATLATTATTATTATNANYVAVTNNTTTNASCPVAFFLSNAGNIAVQVDSTGLTFNPSTGTVAASEFLGSFVGNATTASSAASLPASSRVSDNATRILMKASTT